VIAATSRLLAILLLGGVITLAQLDQQAMRSPGLALAVPEFASANAARVRAQLDLQLGDDSLVDARRQLLLRPLPAESLTLFAFARAATGDDATATAALEAASTRGWREPVSQLASGEAALQQDEHAIAAQRIVALLSTGDLVEPALDLLARLLATPEGRAAFAYRMAQAGHWQGNRLPDMAGAVDPADLAATLALAQAQGARLPCDRLALVASGYRQRGEQALLAQFWPENCAEI
jgi:hypothetical protein